ncbi:MAG: lamin tail domain-containing protein, partial [Verrucomicrobiaceae bacterium]
MMFPPSATFRLVLLLLLLAALPSRAYDSVVVINELQYHPANEETETEWVELRSLHGVDVNLSNWSLTGQVEFTFPEGTILPGGGYLVVAKVPGQIPGAVGPFSGQLNNSGGTLRLLNQNGRIMDEVEYSDSGDWPVGADGSGATLARRDASARTGAGAWIASTELNGTPGGTNVYEGASPVETIAVGLGEVWKYEDSGNS